MYIPVDEESTEANGVADSAAEAKRQAQQERRGLLSNGSEVGFETEVSQALPNSAAAAPHT